MSYLGTLVNTQPAASVPRGIEPALERHVELESASAPGSVASEPVAAAPGQRPGEQEAQAAPTASVEDALRAAFEWVSSPRLVSPAITAEVDTEVDTEIAAPTRGAAAPMDASRAMASPHAPQPLEAQGRSIALPALSQMSEQAERVNTASGEAIELTSVESPPTLEEKKPRRRAIAAQRSPASDVAAAEEVQTTSARPSQVQVRIGTLSLDVRTPAAPAPAPKAAAPVPAPERRAASAAFAFSARRHHLRWG